MKMFKPITILMPISMLIAILMLIVVNHMYMFIVLVPNFADITLVS